MLIFLRKMTKFLHKLLRFCKICLNFSQKLLAGVDKIKKEVYNRYVILAFYKIKQSNVNKSFFTVWRALEKASFFLLADDKNNDKIKKNFKKWEAPADDKSRTSYKKIR